MFNLLPQEDKGKILSEYRFRLAIVGLFFLASLGVIALATLFPSFLLTSQIKKERTENLSIIQKEVTSISTEDLSKILKIENKKVQILSSKNDSLFFYELIASVIKSRTGGIKIFGVDVKTSDKNTHEINVIGASVDRNSLRSFAKALEGKSNFDSVVVPVSNFAPDSDIDFSILIKAK